MNSKRLLFILLLIVALVGAAATVYFLFWKPTREALPPEPAPVTGSLPTGIDTTVAPSQAVPTTPVAPPAADSPSELERKAREALFRRSRDLTSRLATASNADGFAALTQVYDDVTPEVRAFLEGERARLNREHPVPGPTYAQTVRALAARLTQDTEVRTANEVEVTVDVQQYTEQGEANATVLRQALLQLVRNGSVWKISRVTWQDVAL